MIVLLVACAGAPVEDTGGEGGVAEGPVALTDASNYAYTIDLSLGVAPIAVSPEAAIDWTGFTEDIQGFSLDPSRDVAEIDLVWFRDLTPAEVEEGLVAGGLTQASIGLFATVVPEQGLTALPLASLDLYGTQFHPEEYMGVEGGAWLLRLKTPGNDEATAIFLEPSAGAPEVVSITNETSSLAFDPDLASLAPVRLGPGMEVDWSGLTRDGRGAALDPLTLQELWIARYDGLDVATLENRFFELEALPTDTWRVSAYGEDGVALGAALNAAGEAFPGPSTDATWLMALRCLLCTSPAPVYLTVLDPG